MRKKEKNNLPESEKLDAAELSLLSTQEDRSHLPPHDMSDRAKAVRYVKRNPLFIASAIVILLALIASAILGTVLLLRHIGSQPSKADFTILLGEDEPITVSYDYAMRDGILFLDVKRIAAFCGMKTLGSEDRVKFVFSDEQYLRFENESEYVIINGSEVEMSSRAVVNRDECLVPFSFLQKVIRRGVSIKWDTQTNVITVKRQRYKSSGEIADMLFVTDGFEILRSVKQQQKIEISADDYPIDIEAYLSYINPDSMPDMLVLANKENPLGPDYAPTDLVGLENIGIRAKNSTLQLRSNAAYALWTMLEAMKVEAPEAYKTLIVTSAYRTYAYQKDTYERYVKQHMAEGMSQAEAEAAASEYSARAGESEHQTGLCLDFIEEGGTLDTTFENTAAFTWLSQNAHLYGFILRYPDGYEGITGYTYEPWHYRFVGRDAAVEMYEWDLTFEEYLKLN